MPRNTRKISVSTIFRSGDQVNIFRIAPFQQPFIEGRARIVAPIDLKEGLYRVRFDGEGGERVRLVHTGDWQSNPERLLAELHAEWLQSLTPELIAEFFPDDMRDQGGRS